MELIKLPEPELLFGYDQSVEDPRDGLTLFGPLDKGKPYGIRSGVIGTPLCLELFRNWIKKIQGPIGQDLEVARPVYPGFEAAFGIPWNAEPTIEIGIPEATLYQSLYLDDKYLRVYKTVELFEKQIVETIKHEDLAVDVWFVIITDDVYKYGRPMSQVTSDLRIEAKTKLDPRYAKKLLTYQPLFPEDRQAAKPYHYDVHFHNQLKARLLEYSVPTQIIRESTLSDKYISPPFKRPNTRKWADARSAAIAWNLSATTFYKAGGRPWKLSGIRKGVCYIGLAFKRDERSLDPRSACCAAQMFLDSGDGVVFKGAVGPWYKPKRGDFHLSRNAARELIQMGATSYKEKTGRAPTELFLHGKIRFNNEEWEGFSEAADPDTKLVGVRIREDNDFKLFRTHEYPVLRGMAAIFTEKSASLWTKGFVPRLQTYVGREVPRPLSIEICRGEADIVVVLNDIMALTKLNYNTCIYSDGPPVTLKFADAVGEILTAGPLEAVPPLSFKFYI